MKCYRQGKHFWRFISDHQLYDFMVFSHGKEIQKSNMAVWGGLTNSCEKKRSKKQRRKGMI